MLSEDTLKTGSLCVVGNINRDVKTAPFRGENILADGETSVSGIVETVGGGGANSAFTAAALGAKTSFIGKVGADALGERLQRTLVKFGITSALCRDPEHGSGTSLALTYTSGHRHFVSCLPANRAFKFDDIKLDQLTGHDHLLRADIWFSENMLFEGNRALLQAARRAQLRTSVDLNWDPAWGVESSSVIRERKKAVREILPFVDLAHGNVRELCEFADAPELEGALKRLASWGAGAVIVHMGSSGAGFYAKDLLQVEPPAPARHQVNATGTGDVLSVCMMLMDRCPASPLERLKLANKIVTEFIEGQRSFIPPLCD